MSRCQGQGVRALDARLNGDRAYGRSRSILTSIFRRVCRLKPGSGLTSRWMASPSTSPCSAVVSASISRSGHDLLTDFAWHSGLFAAAAATTWVARSGLLPDGADVFLNHDARLEASTTRQIKVLHDGTNITEQSDTITKDDGIAFENEAVNLGQ